MPAFDHRASIINYLDRLADKKEAGDLAAATELRAASSSVRAMLDITVKQPDIVSPVEAIIRETVAAFSDGVNFREIVAPTKGSLAAIRIRFAAMWVAKKRLGWSEDAMEADFRRDRSTIVHGIERAVEIRDEDAEYKRITDNLVAHDIRCENCQHVLIPA